MNLQVGIVGLPNVGKSTLFNALTKNEVAALNYPFCTIDPAVGIVPVPDRRLQTLTNISGSADTIPAVIEFVDIAGLVEGASTGEGLGNKFLSHIREVDMIAEVVRVFEDPDIIHVDGLVQPLKDIEVIDLELVMADAETVNKRLSAAVRDAKFGEPAAVLLQSTLERLSPHLAAGRPARTLDLTKAEHDSLKELHLLTTKKILYVCNKKQGAQNLDETGDERWTELLDFFTRAKADYVTIDAGVEEELKELSEEEKIEFRREYGTLESGVNDLIKQCYNALDLISYFTTGPKETRAWTVRRGSKGPEAGAAIHTDFRDKYIRAQVVSFSDLVKAESISRARQAGKLRIEGKEYIVSDGDVIEFMI